MSNQQDTIGGEDSSSLSSHTLHMRRALEDLRCGMKKLNVATMNYDAGDGRQHNMLTYTAFLASQRYAQGRADALKDVHERLNEDPNCLPIDTVHMREDGSWKNVDISLSDCDYINMQPGSAYEFKQRYIIHNVPCIVQGLGESCFADISSQWRSADNQINTDWFSRFIGNDTLVPIRIDNSIGNELDDDGRADECETKQMKLGEWISQSERSEEDPTNDNVTQQIGYLKDWHLVQYLKSSNAPRSLPLYTTPDCFQRDLLNNFLQRYSEGGDYKFVYWGLTGSNTRLHSDVLNSFSWSYNVVGKKKWIFHVPSYCSDSSQTINCNAAEKTFELIQQTGETIFVPSTWKHEVTNLVETISINHNWITSANIDNTWQCLMVEMVAIEDEMKMWGTVPDNDYEARENMLRGCIGLDITMFVHMLMLEIVELLLISLDTQREKENEIWDCAYSICRIRDVLFSVMEEPTVVRRLEAVLHSETHALEVDKFATDLILYVDKLNENAS